MPRLSCEVKVNWTRREERLPGAGRNYLEAPEAIDAGVTTLLDWSHITNTPEHADEAIHVAACSPSVALDFIS
jgi:hypothetical protein